MAEQEDPAIEFLNNCYNAELELCEHIKQILTDDELLDTFIRKKALASMELDPNATYQFTRAEMDLFDALRFSILKSLMGFAMYNL